MLIAQKNLILPIFLRLGREVAPLPLRFVRLCVCVGVSGEEPVYQVYSLLRSLICK